MANIISETREWPRTFIEVTKRPAGRMWEYVASIARPSFAKITYLDDGTAQLQEREGIRTQALALQTKEIASIELKSRGEYWGSGQSERYQIGQKKEEFIERLGISERDLWDEPHKAIPMLIPFASIALFVGVLVLWQIINSVIGAILFPILSGDVVPISAATDGSFEAARSMAWIVTPIAFIIMLGLGYLLFKYVYKGMLRVGRWFYTIGPNTESYVVLYTNKGVRHIVAVAFQNPDKGILMHTDHLNTWQVARVESKVAVPPAPENPEYL